jgi:dimethylglycine dehydrogenase
MQVPKSIATRLTQKPNGEWIVHTEKGDITAEHIVNAGGYRCNEVGAMMGVMHPVASMEHQYFLTEPIKDIEALDFRVPLIRCPTDDFYCRQEKKGLLVGFYEQECKTWGMDGIDPNFTSALCPDDAERVTPVLENVFKRLPCLTETGIHTIINGPITYTPDGLPIVGRIPGKRSAWCIRGFVLALAKVVAMAGCWPSRLFMVRPAMTPGALIPAASRVTPMSNSRR